MKLMTWPKAIALLIIITYLAGCASVGKITSQELNNLKMDSAMITLKSGTRVKISDYYITSDTLFWAGYSGTKKYVLLNDIKQISFCNCTCGIFGSIIGGLAGMGLVYIAMYEKPEDAGPYSFASAPFYYAFTTAGIVGAIGGSVVVGELSKEEYEIVKDSVRQE